MLTKTPEFIAGLEAFESGKPVEANPYDEFDKRDSQEFFDWRCGWWYGMFQDEPVESAGPEVVICPECDTRVEHEWKIGTIVCPNCRATVRNYT